MEIDIPFLEEGSNSSSSSSSNNDQAGRKKGVMSTLSISTSDTVALLEAARSNYYFGCIPKEYIEHSNEDVHINNSKTTTIFLLLNTMIGSGILLQPYMFARTGMLLAFCEYLAISFFLYHGVQLTMRVADKEQIFDFTLLANKVLGPWGGFSVDVSILLGNLGALLSYVLIIGSLLHSTVGDCDSSACNIGFLTVMPVALLTTPLCLIRQFGHLAIISYFSIFIVSCCACLVLIGGPIHASNHWSQLAPVKVAGVKGAVQTVGDIVFALGFITAAFPAYYALENKTIRDFAYVVKTTNYIGVLMCAGTGLVGYISFRQTVEDNVLLNFHGIVGGIFKVALCIHLVLYIPGDFVILRISVFKLFKRNVDKASDTLFVASSLCMMSVVIFVGTMLNVFYSGSALNLVVDITGGITGSFLYLIMPGMLGAHTFPKWEPGSAKDLTMDGQERYVSLNTLSIFTAGFGLSILLIVIVGLAI